MKKASKLRKAREERKLQGYEIAEILNMYIIRYMSIEIEWEGVEPTEEEVMKICAFFKMSPRALGFGSEFWFLSCEVPA